MIYPDSAPRVLVIDDSPDIHKLLDVRLRGEGLALLHATDPVVGLRLAREAPPDLILLDMDMANTNGLSVCRALKEDLTTAAVPVIFLSAIAGIYDKVAGFDAGAVDYIVKPFDPAELRARVRAALRTKRYQDMLALRALLDAVTGLRNRTYFEARLTDELAAVRRYARNVCLIMVDLDHFKAVNDTYGHPFGDRVLQRVGGVIEGTLRTTDAPCRYGGEEFALLLPETDHAQGLLTAERVRAAIAATGIDRGNEVVHVTASLGLASTDTFADPTRLSAATLVQASDAAMYRAKRQGRNRVVADDGDLPAPAAAS